jgi:CheY-like chemotaxis protein
MQQKILVIDDDETIRETIGIMLERENFAPLYAADGKSGFEKALALKPQLLLVDLRLPEMSGVDVCRKLRSERVQTPIIILSAVGDEVDKVLLLAADDAGWTRSETDPGRIQLVDVLLAESGPGADARCHSQFRLGIRIVSEHENGRRSRRSSSSEARTRFHGATSLPYYSRRRLSLSVLTPCFTADPAALANQSRSNSAPVSSGSLNS